MANDYVVLDLEKPVATLVDLRKNFQGRVGDSRAYCKLWIKSNGLPLDLTDKHVGFSGVDPNGDKWNAVGWCAADQPGDDQQVGRVTYYFPSGMFRVEGDWDTNSTYFYVDDEKQDSHISTINVWLRILANQVEMGINAEPFKTDLDKAVDEVRTYAKKRMADIDSALAALNSDTLQMKWKSLNDVLNNYVELIKDKGVPTFKDMEDYVSKLFGAHATTQDFDLLMPAGTYIVTNAKAGNNPAKTTGLLYVVGDGENSIMQMFLDNEQNLWVRSGGSDGWSDWREQVAWK